MTGPYERRAFPLTLRSDGGTPRSIVGHAAVFESDSDEMGTFVPFRERIRQGAFDDALARVRDGKDDVYALLNHDENYVIASTVDNTLQLSVDDVGLVAKIQPMDTQTIRDLVVTPIEQGKIRKMSFGFTVSDEHGERRGDVDYRIIDKIGRLFDVSPVVFPAYPATSLSMRDAVRALGLRPESIDIRQYASLRSFVETFAHTLPREWRATWDAAYINDLPDSAFAYIEAGGDKDADGRTTPRSLRHFPHHDSSGSVDADHVRNALSRIPQSNVSADGKAAALAHVERHAKALDIGQTSSLQLSVAGGKAVPAAVAPVLPAGAGNRRLRDLELRDHEIDFFTYGRSK